MMEIEHPVAAGIAACHAEALYRRAPAAAELLPQLDALGPRLVRSLGDELGGLLGIDNARLRWLGVETVSAEALAQRIGALAANATYTLAGGEHRLLVSIDGAGILAELDRIFGGPGQWDGGLPECFPVSAEFLAERLEQRMAEAFIAQMPAACALHAAARDTSYGMIAPFTSECMVSVASVEVGAPYPQPWRIQFALPAQALPTLLRQSAQVAGEPRQPASPLDAPFADLPLPLVASIVDMTVPLSRLVGLAAGAIIPVSVARQVPLVTGDVVIARGTVGELDDQIAIQLAQPQAA